MNGKTLGKFILAVILIAAGVVIYVVSQQGKSPAPQIPEGKKLGYAWQFTDAGTDSESGAPLTKVTLTRGPSVSYTIGTYMGSCSDISDSSWKPLENEKTGVICWFAGGGKEIGIFSKNGKDVVKVGDLDEGDAETAGVRGNFQTVLEINLD